MTLQQALARAAEYERAGEPAEAESLYRQVLDYEPNQVQAIYGLSGMALQTGRYVEALALINRALAIRPEEPSFLGTQGLILVQVGRLDEAIQCYRRALELRPDFPELHYQLGNALLAGGQWQLAVPAYLRAIELRPDYADAISNCANALTNSGDLDGAIALCRRALAARPKLSIVRRNLGWALRESGRTDEAIACIREGLELQPDVKLHSDLLFVLHFHCGFDRERLAEEHPRWYEIYARPLEAPTLSYANERRPERRLRVGYVAHDLGNVPLGRFLLPLLTHHDSERIEVICYCDLLMPDSVGQALKRHSTAWRETGQMSDSQVFDLVRRDGIDILVDLALHTNGNRLLMFARKPAPVQVSYLAYCSTTGVRSIDYRFTDEHLDPTGEEDRFYVEESIRLPSYWCYPAPAEAPAITALPALSNRFITFGSLNDFAKTSPELLSAWAQLLNRTANSRLILHCKQGSHRQEVLDRLARDGVSAERVEFAGRMPLSEYLATYGRIDIGLDPFSWSGGITTCDALWMGVPVVSLAGNRAVARGGLSILSNVGLEDLVARSMDDYVRIAAELAADPNRLTKLRESLRKRMQSSPLMNPAAFARSVEDAYRRMWRKWCEDSTGIAERKNY